MKKILFVITKAGWGGAQRYVYDLATHCPPAYEPVVVAGGGGALAERLKGAGIRTLVVPTLQRDISWFKEFSALAELIKVFKTEKPDIVHLNSSKAGAIGALAARLAGVPRIIYTAHGWAYGEKVSVLSRAFRWTASLITMLLAHETITVSEYDRMRAPLGMRTTRIYNGIACPMALGSGEHIRSAFPPGTIITGTIGELNKNKNQLALIRAARQDPTINVAIVGEGDLRGVLVSAIMKFKLKSHVKLFGFMPAEEALPGFDRFAFPSLKEGLPYALLEAKCAGLPLVMVNRVGGIPEILDRPMSDFMLERMMRETVAVYES